MCAQAAEERQHLEQQLMSQLDDKAAQLTEASAQVEQLQQELEGVSRGLEEAVAIKRRNFDLER